MRMYDFLAKVKNNLKIWSAILWRSTHVFIWIYSLLSFYIMYPMNKLFQIKLKLTSLKINTVETLKNELEHIYLLLARQVLWLNVGATPTWCYCKIFMETKFMPLTSTSFLFYPINFTNIVTISSNRNIYLQLRRIVEQISYLPT